MQPDVDDKNAENEVVDDFDDDAAEATVVMSEDSFDDGDISMEVNVESLVKELDRSNVEDAARKKEVRRKLEELAEEQSFEDTYAVEFDND